MIQYLIERDVGIDCLQGKVRENISKGWEPVGGVGYGEDMYFQAMVVREEEGVRRKDRDDSPYGW